MTDERLTVPTSSPIGTLVFLLWGMIVWGLQFTAAYVGHTFLCRIGAGDAATDVLVAALTIAALAALAAVGLLPERAARFAGIRLRDEDRRPLVTISRVIVGLATVAAVWTASGIVFLDACAPGR